jgi:carboxymethylenebutenolidase
LLPDGQEMPALLASPQRESVPAVLVIADMFGSTPFYRQLIARLAGAGFRALLPEYFFRLEPLSGQDHEAGFARRRKLDEVGTLDDLRAAISHLRGEASEPVGVVGFCMGGTFALDLAATEEQLVTVAYYGFPVPQSFLASPPPAPLGLVEKMAGPILGIWGDQDEIVGMDNVEEFGKRMKSAGKDYEEIVYPGLGHGFLGQAAFNGEGDADASWEAAVAHLRRGLSG